MKQTHKTKPILENMSPSDKERFWSKVDVKSDQECWPWKDSLNKDGYGTLSIGGREDQQKLLSHRVAKTLSIGIDIEPGKLVLHACDNPPCCNPKHLFVADHQTNMDDMFAKDRSAISFANAKVDWDTVDYIRASDKSGNRLASELILSKATISDIKNNKIWKDEYREVAQIPRDIDVYQMNISEDGDITFVI